MTDYLPEWFNHEDRLDPRWRILWGVLGLDSTLTEHPARRVWGWYMDGAPAGGRNADRYDIAAELRRVSAEQGVWAFLRLMAYQRPLTKKGKPSKAKGVEVRCSFQDQAREWLDGENDHPGPLSARQLLRAVQWYPVPVDVHGLTRAVLSEALSGELWPVSMESLKPARTVSGATLAGLASDIQDGLLPPWADPADVFEVLEEGVELWSEPERGWSSPAGPSIYTAIEVAVAREAGMA